MVNPRVSHPPVITIDVGGFFTTQSWIQMVAFLLACPHVLAGTSCHDLPCHRVFTGKSYLPIYMVIESWRFFLCSLFFWGFHGVPKLAGCLSSWENPHWNGWWLGVPIKKSRVNLMKLDETQDIGNRNRGSSSWWGRTSLCFVFI